MNHAAPSLSLLLLTIVLGCAPGATPPSAERPMAWIAPGQSDSLAYWTFPRPPLFDEDPKIAWLKVGVVITWSRFGTLTPRDSIEFFVDGTGVGKGDQGFQSILAKLRTTRKGGIVVLAPFSMELSFYVLTRTGRPDSAKSPFTDQQLELLYQVMVERDLGILQLRVDDLSE